MPPELYTVKKTKIIDPDSVTRKIDAVDVPRLGPVAGGAVMTRTTLTRSTVSERGYRDHGFKIYVHEKLANPEDELFGITQRSLKYWYRFRGTLEIPSLDKVLLVHRNGFSEQSEVTYVAREVMRALFGDAKGRYVDEEEEAAEYEPEPFGTRLRFLAPISGQLAVRGLSPEGQPVGNLGDIEVGFSPDGPEADVAKYMPEELTISVNEDHPLIAALDDIGGTHGKQLRQVLGEVAAGTIMSSGYLRSRHVDADVIDEAAGLVDDSFRSAAGYLRDPLKDFIDDMEETAETGGTPFEKAVVRALRSLRLSATRKGGPELPDGVVEIPIAGAPNLRIAIEAKGSKHPITHVEINPATLEEHQKQLGCSRSVVVARRFQTEGRGAEGSVLLRITKEHNLPLITTSTIGGILRLHQQRPFTHPKLVRILTTWHDPEGLDAWVREIWQDSPDPGVLRLVLELAYDAQNKDSTNSPSPGMILVDDRIRKRKITTAQLAGILEAVQTTTGLLHIINPQTYEFELLQDPETIVEAMTKAHDEDLGKVSAAGSKSEPKG